MISSTSVTKSEYIHGLPDAFFWRAIPMAKRGREQASVEKPDTKIARQSGKAERQRQAANNPKNQQADRTQKLDSALPERAPFE